MFLISNDQNCIILARDMWKKKYFGEKKKTPTLEERVLLLKGELDQVHKKTIQMMDNETKHAGQVGYAKEVEAGVKFNYSSLDSHSDIYSFVFSIN